MNLKSFFVASLQTALDVSIATPEDILKHVTPDVLSQYLPRPLWARLFTACLGAPKVDAQLVVETIGIPNLCEHVPAQLIWAVIADIGHRSLGKPISEDPIVLRPRSVTPEPTTSSTPSSGIPSVLSRSSSSQPLTAPPPDVITKPSNPPLAPPPKVGPSIPAPSTSPAGTGSQSLSDIVAELEAEGSNERSTSPSRVRTPTQQRFRQSQTGIGRLAEKQPSTRRPQAAAPAVPGRPARRGETEAEELETETAVAGKDGDWRNALAVDVEDEQLVDWQSSEETLTVADDEPRKR